MSSRYCACKQTVGRNDDKLATSYTSANDEKNDGGGREGERAVMRGLTRLPNFGDVENAVLP